jgi:hypothetical protein
VVTDTRPGSPTFGQPVCRSVTDGTDTTCVPYDVFNDNVSAEAVDYLSATGLQSGQTSEQIAHVDFTGLLGEYGLKFPWAEDGVAVNLGAEYRKERLDLTTRSKPVTSPARARRRFPSRAASASSSSSAKFSCRSCSAASSMT